MASREEILQEYHDTLKKFDFTYRMSDDNRYYKRGEEKDKHLKNLQLQLVGSGLSMKEIKDIWNDYAPPGFGHNEEA